MAGAMGLPARRLACAGVLAALVAAVAWWHPARRGGARPRPRDGGPASAALAPENLRRWVSPRARRAWTAVATHGRTTGYRAAASELVWLDGQRRGKICATAELPDVEAAARPGRLRRRALAARPRAGAEPTPDERRALSHFHVANRTEAIEPLHGVARHPPLAAGLRALAPTHAHDAGLFDITYLVIHNACGRPGPKPRTLLFDMGASVGFAGVPGGVYATLPTDGGGLAPSLPLFYRIYADRCLEPDEVYAWEPNPRVRGADWWGELPARLRAKVRFYNDIVDEGEIEQAEGSA